MSNNSKKVVWLLMEQERGEYSSAIRYWFGILERLGYDVTYYAYEAYNPEEFYLEMQRHSPDYIFHPCYNDLHVEFTRLREFTKVYVVQSDDDWRFQNYSRHYIPFVDGTISYQAEKQWYLDSGARPNEIISAKWAFNPNTMLLEQPSKVKDVFISHGGSMYGNRAKLIEEFKQKGVPITTANDVKYEELLSLWDRSKYSLCFTESSQGNFRQKKGRVAEIAYHSVLVSEPFPNIEEYYEPGKEFILFSTVEEAIDKIQYYEKNQTEYTKMFLAGRQRVWQTNTVYHQWNSIMKQIDEDYVEVDVDKILKEYAQSN